MMYIQESTLNKAFCEVVNEALGGPMDTDETWRFLCGANDLRLKVLKTAEEQDTRLEEIEKTVMVQAESKREEREPHGRYL